MSGKIAIRNILLCSKDCLCLYVCPTGASDTENSIIDADKCIGCGACADACPSGAISLVPREYPPQQAKAAEVIAALRGLAASKMEQEQMAARLPGKLARARLYAAAERKRPPAPEKASVRNQRPRLPRGRSGEAAQYPFIQ